MRRVVHVVVTHKFAGVERYVANTASELAGRDWEVSVVGGDSTRMAQALAAGVQWLPGATPLEALRSLTRLGRQDICHVHMTLAEAVGVAARSLHRARIVSTRHFAAVRGSSRTRRALSPLISAQIAREIAVSRFVASRIERVPDAVLLNGVPDSPYLWRESSRVVLVLQRLEPEKDTLTALRAWQASHLWEDGWSLRIVGAGSEREALERLVRKERLSGVTFAGWLPDVAREFAGAGVLIAPAPAEPFGLSALEAMAAGVPVVACSGGGHLETVGLLPNARLFPNGDAEAAAERLRSFVPEKARRVTSEAGRELVTERFSLERHVGRLVDLYERVAGSRRRPGAGAPFGASADGPLNELVVCSLDSWDDVWRRNQFLTDILLRRNPGLRVLFIEPPADPLHDLSRGRRPAAPSVRVVGYEGRLRAFRPLKVLPRRAGNFVDGFLREQVFLAVRLLGFHEPLLWINDVTYAPLIAASGWPSLYDVTDDWLLAPASLRERERLRRFDGVALESADEVVVCSRNLAASRGARRPISLIPNGVDLELFRRPRERPADLPQSPVAVYVGTLHESRLDVPLVAEIAVTAPNVTFALVGPDSLAASSRGALSARSNILLLGPKHHRDVPAYLQHADVVIVPHLVTEFTESLDPIKAYECLAVGRPTVATPVAGFRGLEPPVHVADRGEFAAAVREALHRGAGEPSVRVPSWSERSEEFERILHGIVQRRS